MTLEDLPAFMSLPSFPRKRESMLLSDVAADRAIDG
jgi:hypothetical protein